MIDFLFKLVLSSIVYLAALSYVVIFIPTKWTPAIYKVMYFLLAIFVVGLTIIVWAP